METTMMGRLRAYLKSKPASEIQKELEEIESKNIGGPTVSEYFEQFMHATIFFDGPDFRKPPSEIFGYKDEKISPVYTGLFFNIAA
jgi:hypothetical protein